MSVAEGVRDAEEGEGCEAEAEADAVEAFADAFEAAFASSLEAA